MKALIEELVQRKTPCFSRLLNHPTQKLITTSSYVWKRIFSCMIQNHEQNSASTVKNANMRIRPRKWNNVLFTRNFTRTSTMKTTPFNPEQRSIPSSSSPFSMITDVTELAQEIRDEVRAYTKQLVRAQSQQQQQQIKLVGILAHNGPFRSDSENYSQHIAETFAEDGIAYELHRVIGENPHDVEMAIHENNRRQDVHGILVYYPIFKHHYPLPSSSSSTTNLNERSNDAKSDTRRGPYKNSLTGVYYKTYDDYLRDLVCPTKDVEGLCQQYNARWLFRSNGKRFKKLNNNSNKSRTIKLMGQNHITENNSNTVTQNVVYPCTALSVLRILERYAKKSHRSRHHHQQQDEQNPQEGIVVTIINRSEIFGRPLAAMLAQQGATVYSIDEHSTLLFRQGGRIKRITDRSLQWCLEQSSIVVTGVPSPDFWVPCESIQPGTTLVNVSEFPNADEESLLDIPDVQYIPHVGKVTIAIMEQNLMDLHKRVHSQPTSKTNG